MTDQSEQLLSEKPRCCAEFHTENSIEYHHILRFKGERAVWYVPNGQTLSVGELYYRSDIAAGKVVYHNDTRYDFANYLKNNHEYLSFLASSKFHPFSKLKRCLVFGMSLAMSIAVGLLQNGIQAEVKNRQWWTDLVITVSMSVLTTVFGKVTSKLALCSCAQKLSDDWKKTKTNKQTPIVCECVMFAWISAQNADQRPVMETVAVIIMIAWFLLFGGIITAVGMGLSTAAGLNTGKIVLLTLINCATSAFAVGPLVSFIFGFTRKRWKDVSAAMKQVKRESEGKSVSHKYKVPFIWFEEWKQAGYPRFPSDDPSMSKEELERTFQSTNYQINQAVQQFADGAVRGLGTAFSPQTQTLLFGPQPNHLQTRAVGAQAGVYGAVPPTAPGMDMQRSPLYNATGILNSLVGTLNDATRAGVYQPRYPVRPVFQAQPQNLGAYVVPVPAESYASSVQSAPPDDRPSDGSV